MEKLLHYVWQHRMLPLAPLRTTDGRDVEVVDVGLLNTNAGPDFFNAKVRIGDTMWAGNVEIHMRSTDWYAHGHDKDVHYNNTILHVVAEADGVVQTQDGKQPPQVVIQIPESLREDYDQLLSTMDYPRCHSVISRIPVLKAHAWVDALLVERLQERAGLVLQRLKDVGGDWEAAFFVTLARNFGFGVNGDAFEAWGRRVPLFAAAKHRDDAFQVEALFLGTAGLLDVEALPQSCRAEAGGDDYFCRIRREYEYLRHKFSLGDSLPYQQWKYLRMRPQNFPHIRLSQLAAMYHEGRCTLNSVLEATDIDALMKVLDMRCTDYWQTHYLFGMESKPNNKSLTLATRRLIVINTIVPVLFAYGMQHSNEDMCDRAIAMLEALPSENNYIIRQWRECGLTVDNAADTQALIQLKRAYCDKHDCLRCRFGYEFLKQHNDSKGRLYV